MGDADREREAMEILRPRLEALERLSWAELDAHAGAEETLDSPSGWSFRVVTGTYWDMEEWASEMQLFAKAYPTSGWRRRFPYTLTSARGGPDDPVPEPPPGWAPQRRFLGFRLRGRR